MKPAPFDYSAPSSLAEALARLDELGEHGKVLAGGQSLLPLLSMRLAAPEHLVDINHVPGLDRVEVSAGVVRVGALVRHAELERHQPAAAAQPLLRQAVRLVAHPTIRNRGTSVGSIAHADPAAELPAVLTVLGGSVELSSRAGTRTLPAAEFFLGPLETALRPGELVTSASFPVAGPRAGTAFVELSRRHGDYALVGVAAVVGVSEDGRIEQARVGLVSVGPTPLLVDLGAILAGSRGPRAGRARGRHPRQCGVPVPARRGADRSRAGRSAGQCRDKGGGVSVEVGAQVTDGQAAGEQTREVTLRVNGVQHRLRLPVRRLLSDALRHDLELTGTHVGCEHGVCGACTVLLDGAPVRSCLLLAVSVDGQEITTVEGLAAADGRLHPVQQAFREKHGLQCGFCTPGFLVTAAAFLRETPQPSAEQAREAISGNLCRCTGYQNIVASVLRAAELAGEEPA